MTATTDTGELPTVSTAPPAVPAPSPAPSPVTEPEPATRGATVAAPAPAAEALVPGSVGVVDRLWSVSTRRLTAPGGVVLALLVLAPGVLLDLATDGTFGVASSVSFVGAGVAAALAMRVRALATAAVLPPLLFVTAVTVLARFSGNNQGNRELVLDVGTTLAISAPVLFGGTVASLAVILARLLVGLARR